MKLWGKTRDELDAERHEAIARREHLAKRDAEAKDRLVADMIREAPRATAMSPQALGAYYSPLISAAKPRDDLRRQYFFGEDTERFDSLPDEMAVYVDTDDALPPPGWPVLGMAVLSCLAVIGVAYLVMAR